MDDRLSSSSSGYMLYCCTRIQSQLVSGGGSLNHERVIWDAASGLGILHRASERRELPLARSPKGSTALACIPASRGIAKSKQHARLLSDQGPGDLKTTRQPVVRHSLVPAVRTKARSGPHQQEPSADVSTRALSPVLSETSIANIMQKLLSSDASALAAKSSASSHTSEALRQKR